MFATTMTFSWRVWRKHGNGLLVVFSVLLILCLVSAVAPAYCSPDVARNIFGVGLSIVLPMLALYLLAIFTYGEEGANILARESGFPVHQFTLPVRTSALVVWPLATGSAAMVVLWLILALFILRPWLAVHETAVPLWWPAALAMATLAWFQALLWLPFGLCGLRLLLLSVLLPGLISLVDVVLEGGVSEGAYVGIFAGLAAIAWMLAYRGVQRARCGDVPNWEAVYRPFLQLLRWLPRRRLSFASAASAQTWFEWRLGGNSLPIMTAMVLPWGALPLYLGDNDILPTAHTVLGMLLVPPFLAGMAGGWGRTTSTKKSREQSGRMPFAGMLPVSTTALVSAMLRTAAWSTLAAWAVMVVTLPLVLHLTGRVEEVFGWYRHGLQFHGPTKVITGIVVVVLLLVAWTWKRKVDAIYIGLTGRMWVDALIGWLLVPGFIALWIVAFVIFKRPQLHALTLDVLPWVLGLLLLCRLLLTVWALRVAIRCDLLSPRTLTCWLICWVVLAAILCGLLNSVVTPHVPTTILALGVPLAMPMARLAAAPLALHWNRHR